MLATAPLRGFPPASSSRQFRKKCGQRLCFCCARDKDNSEKTFNDAPMNYTRIIEGIKSVDGMKIYSVQEMFNMEKPSESLAQPDDITQLNCYLKIIPRTLTCAKVFFRLNTSHNSRGRLEETFRFCSSVYTALGVT